MICLGEFNPMFMGEKTHNKQNTPACIFNYLVTIMSKLKQRIRLKNKDSAIECKRAIHRPQQNALDNVYVVQQNMSQGFHS